MWNSAARPSARAIIFNIICFCALILTIILFSKVGKPYHRGFFCDDTSISKPFKESTVSSTIAAIVGIAVPILVMIINEVPRLKKAQESKPFYRTRWFNWLTLLIAFYAIGAAANVVITDCGKYTIGRLRPHFLDVCKPDFTQLNCSTGFKKHYITEYVCTGDGDLIREARLSFPSGHSSFAAYCMVFLVLYIEIRVCYDSIKLFKPLLILVFLLMALLCGMSRVSDYKHHWSDVVAGLLLGSVVAFYFIFRVLRLHRTIIGRDSQESSSPERGSVQQSNDPEKGTN